MSPHRATPVRRERRLSRQPRESPKQAAPLPIRVRAGGDLHTRSAVPAVVGRTQTHRLQENQLTHGLNSYMSSFIGKSGASMRLDRAKRNDRPRVAQLFGSEGEVNSAHRPAMHNSAAVVPNDPPSGSSTAQRTDSAARRTRRAGCINHAQVIADVCGCR